MPKLHKTLKYSVPLQLFAKGMQVVEQPNLCKNKSKFLHLKSNKAEEKYY